MIKKHDGFFWLSTVFTTASFTYFMAILSGGVDVSESCFLILSTIFFAFSLGINSVIAIKIFGDNRKEEKMCSDSDSDSDSDSEYRKVKLFSKLGLLSFVIAVLFVVANFSLIASGVMFFWAFYLCLQFSIEDPERAKNYLIFIKQVKIILKKLRLKL